MSDDRLIVAMDVPHAVAGLELAGKLGDAVSDVTLNLGAGDVDSTRIDIDGTGDNIVELYGVTVAELNAWIA